MVSIVLLPILFIIFLTGLILLVYGLYVKRKKGIKEASTSLWAGAIICSSPLILIAVGFLITSQQYKRYVGKYTGDTESGLTVKLELKKNKDFVMKTNNCDAIVSGTWDCILSDHYILELHTHENKIGIQASVTETNILFYHPLNLACIKNEYLEMKSSRPRD